MQIAGGICSRHVTYFAAEAVESNCPFGFHGTQCSNGFGTGRSRPAIAKAGTSPATNNQHPQCGRVWPGGFNPVILTGSGLCLFVFCGSHAAVSFYFPDILQSGSRY